VSTKDQEDKRSYENQINQIKKYAKEFGLKISDEYRDTISGTTYKRPAFNKLLDSINNYKGVIVAFIDRLGRDFVEQMNLFVKLYNSGTDVHVVDFGKINMDSIDDQFRYILESWFAAKENLRRRKRQLLGIERYKKEHGRWGRKEKKIDWKKYEVMKKSGVFSESEIARALGVSRTTLYNKKKNRKKNKNEGKRVEKY